LQELTRRWRGTGHDVHVVTTTPGERIVDDAPVHRIQGSRVPRFGFVWSPGAVRAIGDTLAREGFDVAHCHVSIVSPAAIGGALWAHRLGMPAVLTFHSFVPHTRSLARAANIVLGSSKWRARFTAVSRVVAEEVRPFAGGQEIGLLPNATDVPFWRAAAASRRDNANALEIVAVMRLNRKKRPIALVALMARLRREAPNARFRLRVVGDGPQRRSMMRAILRFKLAERIELLGLRPREEIRELFSASDVFVLPAVRESFGLAALEARCAGLPVVAMAGSGVADFIQHGREGLLAHSDPDLAHHVASLWARPSLREAIAGHNRATPPPYDWARAVKAHEDVYRDAMALRVSDPAVPRKK
jgi:glycosyltransferase involved in cell wall biosynthesis